VRGRPVLPELGGDLFNQSVGDEAVGFSSPPSRRSGCRVWRFALSLITGMVSGSIDIRQHC
jgi:hypothetical protein